MRPIKLTMQAFQSYGKETVVDFREPDQSVFMIVGDTGAGKTSIFDAITFALYGEASSSLDKKNGEELQGHYVDKTIEPFVELEFSEVKEGKEEIYRIRRIPAHYAIRTEEEKKKGRKSKKKPDAPAEGQKENAPDGNPEKGTEGSEAGSGNTPASGGWEERVNGSVALFLPNNTSLTMVREVKAKIEEIVGLSKDEFMQVAMIAQNEFFKVINADQGERKEIFRKIFHTEKYYNLVQALKDRKEKNWIEVSAFQTDFRKYAGKVKIPDAYVLGSPARMLQEKISSSDTKGKKKTAEDKISLPDMENFILALKTLSEYMKNSFDREKAEAERLGEESKKATAAFANGKAILSAFIAKANAEKELEEYASQEEEMKEAEILMEQIRQAYELSGIEQGVTEAEKQAEDASKKLEENRTRLPELKEGAEALEKKKTEKEHAAQEKEKELAVKEKAVQDAIEVIDSLAKVDREWNKAKKDEEDLLKDAEKLKGENDVLSGQIETLRDEEKTLQGTEQKLEILSGRNKRFLELKASCADRKKDFEEIEKERKKVEDSVAVYEEARKLSNRLGEEYTNKQNAFYDAQAGILARDRLIPGKACPVCGNTVHPEPCKLDENAASLTREMVDKMKADWEKASNEAGKKAEEVSRKKSVLAEKEKNHAEAMDRLLKSVREEYPDSPELTGYQDMGEYLEKKGEELREMIRSMEEKNVRHTELQKAIPDEEKKLSDLQEKINGNQEALVNVKTGISNLETSRAELEKRKTYDSREEAERDQEKLSEERRQAVGEKNEADQEWKKADGEFQAVNTLVKDLEERLPGLRQTALDKRKKYEEAILEKGLSEEAWKEIVEKHPQSEEKRLREETTKYRDKVTAAKSSISTAEKTIDGQDEPDMDLLEKTMNDAETARKEAEEQCNNIRQARTDNDSILKELEKSLEERKKAMAQYEVSLRLFNRLNGDKDTGKLDLETYVQRLYLKKILKSANDRFLAMTDNLLKLEMMNDRKAAEDGKGLVLQAYNLDTHSREEIRCLSGGEKFLASLAFALGMSDQIRESSGQVNLDIMFIDEGFGTLDDTKRKLAIRELKKLAEKEGGERLVGLISHVKDLRLEIEDLLFVRRDDEGSHVRWGKNGEEE